MSPRSSVRFFQIVHAPRDGFKFDIESPQRGCVAFQAHFERACAFVELGQQTGFDSLQLGADPIFIFIRQRHQVSLYRSLGTSTSFAEEHTLNRTEHRPLIAAVAFAMFDPRRAISVRAQAGQNSRA
jgi:hypothetical protein